MSPPFLSAADRPGAARGSAAQCYEDGRRETIAYPLRDVLAAGTPGFSTSRSPPADDTYPIDLASCAVGIAAALKLLGELGIGNTTNESPARMRAERKRCSAS